MSGGQGQVPGHVKVQRIAECRLRLSGRDWAFAQQRRNEIEAHWQKRRLENPGFFNGRVLVMEPPRLEDGVLTAELIETDFSSFLFWKDTSYPEAGVRDGFGSAMIRSREGHVLLARQLAGHLNSGLLYLPGGFIDLNDVCGDGRVDIDASIMRELAEETGLGASSFVRRPGYLLTRVGVQVSIAVEFRSELDALELRHLLCSQLRAQGDPELADFVIFDRPPEPSQTDVVAFSRHAIEAVFSGL